MNLSRRGFIGALSGAGVAALVPWSETSCLSERSIDRNVRAGRTVICDLPSSRVTTRTRFETGVLTVGDTFTIEGMYWVDPATGRHTRHLQPFVITADTARPRINEAVR